MARIAGVDLPRDKRIEIALTYIFGIGLTTSKKLLAAADVNPDTRTRDLTEDEVVRLRDAIDKNAVVEGDLRREIQMNIKRLVDIVAAATVSACLSADRTRRTMRARARARRRPSQARKSKGGS